MLDDVVQPGDLLGELNPKERGAPLSHFIPLQAPLEDFVPELAITVPSRDGSPSLMGGVGKDADRKMAVVFLERPTYYRLRRSKLTTEEHHVERFVAAARR